MIKTKSICESISSEKHKPVYKELDIDVLLRHKGWVIKDLVGNLFLTRQAVAAILGCSVVSLCMTHKRNGLRPLDRYVKGHKPYLLEDVQAYYNRREK